MSRCARCAWLVTVALVCGCATQTIKQTTSFAKAGTEYSDAVLEFVDVYVVSRVDINSKDSLRARQRLVEAKLPGDLPKTLVDFDNEALEAVRQTAGLRENVRWLRAYFEALNALVTSNLPDEAGAALKSLGTSINGINTVTGGDEKRFTAEQLNYIEKIGKLAVRAAVAAQVREALERDKRTIAWQIAWQERMLEVLVDPIRQQYETDLKQTYKTKVADPYENVQAKPDTAWVDDRRNWVRSRFNVEAFTKAQKAAARMRAEWEAIIEGRSDIHSVRLALADLKEFTAVIRAYDEEERKKK